MNIKDYEYIVEIARYGNISKAAEALKITQSALTKYLQRLEQYVSTPLFQRVGNRYQPTAAGELYLQKAKQILDLDRELSTELSLLSARQAAIRFGYPMGMFPFVMERLLPAFFARFPNAAISLKEDSSSTLTGMVEAGSLDLCLAYAAERRTGLDYEKITDSCTVLAVPSGSPLLQSAQKKEGFPYPVLDSNAWMEQPYIKIAQHTRSGQRADRYFQQIGTQPKVRLYVDSTRSALMAMEQGLGVCLLTAIPHTDRIVHYLILPSLAQEPQTVYLVTRRNEHVDKACCGLKKLAAELYRDF